MKVKIVGKTKDFLNILKATNVMMPEVAIKVTKEGIGFRGMGISKIDMIDIFYPASDFETFETDETVSFGVKTEDVLKSVKRFGEKVALEVDAEGSVVKFSSEKKRFELRLIAAEDGRGEMPNVPFTSTVVVPYEALVDSLMDIAIQSEFVQLDAGAKLTLTGKGDKGEALSIPETTSIVGEGKTTYSLTNIASLLDAVSGEKAVKIEFGTNMPIKVTLGRISYFHAPRVVQQ